jgi:O-antigen/teichoic acid export membrane protein
MTDNSRDPGDTAPQQPVGTSPRMRDQPALTTSSGRSWLLLGGLLALIALAVLVPMLPLEPAGVALVGSCLIIALYAAMIVVRLNMTPGRGMLAVLASGMIAISIVGLACVLLVASRQGVPVS